MERTRTNQPWGAVPTVRERRIVRRDGVVLDDELVGVPITFRVAPAIQLMGPYRLPFQEVQSREHGLPESLITPLDVQVSNMG